MTDQHGEEIYEMKKCAHIIASLICESCGNINEKKDRENWSAFEEALGCLEYTSIEVEIMDQYDKEGDINPFHTGANYEDAYTDLMNVILKLPKLFSEWISEISPPTSNFSVFDLDIYYSFRQLIEDDDIFLTFNYTETLEELYEVDNITHIHGNRNCPIVGHNNILLTEEKSYFQGVYIDKMKNALKKPTEKIINDNEMFFENLDHDIESIYSYGFSFGEIDLEYIQEMFRYIETRKVTWYLHSHDKCNHEAFKEKINKCGFCGSFSEFDE
ncbi:AbiH family protein [Tetragenococcus halophilus]|uniref:AbiH family protein n=1 Tax=Tetragenococcus halophilus TaxID=51669 RepID=UPI00209B5AC8